MTALHLLADITLIVNEYNQINCDELFEKLKILRTFSNNRALTMFKNFATYFDFVFYNFINKFMKLSCKCNKIKYTNKYYISYIKNIYSDSSLPIKNINYNMLQLIQQIKNEAFFLKIPDICIRNLLYELLKFQKFFKSQFKKSVSFSSQNSTCITFSSDEYDRKNENLNNISKKLYQYNKSDKNSIEYCFEELHF